MKDEKEKADATTPAKKNNTTSSYQTTKQSSTEKRIAKRLESMPKAYRPCYRRAMAGRSRKDAIKSFCLECVYWQKDEVKLCTSKACPLYPYRPYQDKIETKQDVSQTPENRHFTEIPQQDKDGLNNYKDKPLKENQDDKTAITGGFE